MRIVLVVNRTKEESELEGAAAATGAEIQRVFDVEEAVEIVKEGRADAVLATSSEISRLSRGDGQISSYLRHQIMNPLSSILGFAQLLSLGKSGDPEQARAKLDTIAQQALRIRDLIIGDREPKDEPDAS